jgi:hypothetical protein
MLVLSILYFRVQRYKKNAICAKKMSEMLIFLFYILAECFRYGKG